MTQCENFAKQVSEAKKGSYGSTFLENFTLGIKGELAWLKVSVKQHNRYRGKVNKYALVVEIGENEFEYQGSIGYYEFEKIKKTVEFVTGSAYYVKIKDLSTNV